MSRRYAALIGLLAVSASAWAQTPFRSSDALREAYSRRASLTTNRQRLEEARRNAGAAGAYPATRLDLGKDLFNKADIMGSADFLVYQPLDVFGKGRTFRRQGDAAIAVALAAFRQGALDVQQEALTAYANLLAVQRLLEIARAQREVAASVADATGKRVAARDLPEIQAARAELELARADGLLADRKAAVEAARLRLAGALGTEALPDTATLEALVLPPEAKDATMGRPELLSLQAEAALAAADERVARQALIPDLEIQAGRSSFNAAPQYGARLQLTATLWDHGATRSRIRAAEARRKAAESALEDRVVAARKDVAAAEVEYAAAERSVATYARLSEGARTLLERTRRGFDLGASTLLDVLDARRALADAQELSVNAELRQDLAVEAVLRAKGRLLEEPK